VDARRQEDSGQVHDDRKIVDKFGQKPWIHHEEVLNCWSKLLWFEKRGAWLRYSPWLDTRLWGIPYGVLAQSICDCPICRAYLMARVKRGEIVDLWQYSECARTVNLVIKIAGLRLSTATNTKQKCIYLIGNFKACCLW
jgi:hypothetical protein